MTEERRAFFKGMGELDDAAAREGGYVVPSTPESEAFDRKYSIRKISAYAEKHGPVDFRTLTDEEKKQFEK
ncbi:MAG: hypothetical protein LBQ40_02865 [Clostridiales bacterium]|jgi:hypothetical protein|nr:hypothetical protein [Clostridiales bacterium]